MKRSLIYVVVIVAVLGLGWLAYAAYRAHKNLITLHVKDAEIRTVAHSLEWQTWERIIVHKNASGKVTLDVQDMPLEKVLTIISEQIPVRWEAVYPLYSSRKSKIALEKVLVGDAKAEDSGWSAFQPQPFRGLGGGGFGANLRADNQYVNLKAIGKDVGVVALGLERFA